MTSTALRVAIESVMEEFGGTQKLCAVTSDNTSSCRNERRLLAKRHPKVVSVNDQAHVADLLIEDIGKLPWVREVLSVVDGISTSLHGHRKLKEEFRSIMNVYNKEIRAFNVSERLPQKAESGRDTLMTGKTLQRDPKHTLNPKSGIDGVTEYKGAIMLAKSSNTRFAACEAVLESFCRSRVVLGTLVNHERFDELYHAGKEAEKLKRYANFCKPILDPVFSAKVVALYRIVVLLRRYLRVFDSDIARISEVLPFTLELGKQLEDMDVDEHFPAQLKEDVIKLFERRRDGGEGIKVHLFTDAHYAACLLDPNQAPADYTDYLDSFKRHAHVYAEGNEAEKPQAFVARLVLQYQKQEAIWRRGMVSDELRETLSEYAGNALYWWRAGWCKDKELCEFAIRTLSCVPSAMVCDRSFSEQKRVHSKERNLLMKEKVAKLMFCKWNLMLMRGLTVFDKRMFWDSLMDTSRLVHQSDFGDDRSSRRNESKDDASSSHFDREEVEKLSDDSNDEKQNEKSENSYADREGDKGFGGGDKDPEEEMGGEFRGDSAEPRGGDHGTQEGKGASSREKKDGAGREEGRTRAERKNAGSGVRYRWDKDAHDGPNDLVFDSSSYESSSEEEEEMESSEGGMDEHMNSSEEEINFSNNGNAKNGAAITDTSHATRLPKVEWRGRRYRTQSRL